MQCTTQYSLSLPSPSSHSGAPKHADALLKEKVLLKLMAARKRGEHLATVDEEEGRWQVDQPADGDDVSST